MHIYMLYVYILTCAQHTQTHTYAFAHIQAGAAHRKTHRRSARVHARKRLHTRRSQASKVSPLPLK